MLAKDMLAKTRDELLTQNKKSQNEKTIMVPTWYPTLNIYPKYFKKNIINILKRTSTSKKYSQRNQ